MSGPSISVVTNAQEESSTSVCDRTPVTGIAAVQSSLPETKAAQASAPDYKALIRRYEALATLDEDYIRDLLHKVSNGRLRKLGDYSYDGGSLSNPATQSVVIDIYWKKHRYIQPVRWALRQLKIPPAYSDEKILVLSFERLFSDRAKPVARSKESPFKISRARNIPPLMEEVFSDIHKHLTQEKLKLAEPELQFIER